MRAILNVLTVVGLPAAFLEGSAFAAEIAEPPLALPTIVMKVEAAGYTNITLIDREKSGARYEFEGERPNGGRFEILVDAKLGEIKDNGAHKWMPLSTVVKVLQDSGFQTITTLHREGSRYEVNGQKSDGASFEVFFDPETGAIKVDK